MINTILGVDFSGAVLAGEKIWVSRASVCDETLHFDYLERAANLPDGSAARAEAIAALQAWVEAQEGAKCGFDFPFSLVRESIPDAYYATWLKNFAKRYPTAEDLRNGTKDVRRSCDIAAKTPFSPLNLRLYRQTYYGIRDVLAPLQAAGAQILPFDVPEEGKTWLMEICPASLLKREKLYLSYKGKSETQRLNREIIANTLSERIPFSWDADLRQRALDDSEGDALDAVLAALCVFRALQSPESLQARDETDRFEGRVYF